MNPDDMGNQSYEDADNEIHDMNEFPCQFQFISCKFPHFATGKRNPEPLSCSIQGAMLVLDTWKFAGNGAVLKWQFFRCGWMGMEIMLEKQ